MRSCHLLGLCLALLGGPAIALPADGNRLTYLDEFCDPCYPGVATARLATPQWIGEEGVEAVIVLSVDDLGDTATYEKFLRPILDRLKKIDGRAPLSLMTTKVTPDDPQIKQWLQEGLSLEAHTLNHAAPLLQNGNLAKAKETFDRCLDQLRSIPENRLASFRTPWCDSANTVSPRTYTEIFNQTTPAGNFLGMDSSVLHAFTAADPALRALAVAEDNQPRFRRYVLSEYRFVNLIEDYPYPYVIARRCWEMSPMIPDDNLGSRRNGPSNPATMIDLKAALDATVAKQGQFTFCFHPWGWISNERVVEFINYAVEKHGKKVKFLTLHGVYERITKNLLAGNPLRAANGEDNGVRVLDVNGDGWMDVVVANDQTRLTRVWSPKDGKWTTADFPTPITSADADGRRQDMGVRFGVLREDGAASFLVRNEKAKGLWHFQAGRWAEEPSGLAGLDLEGPLATSALGRDRGVRLRDVDGDGRCELIVANDKERATFAWSPDRRAWSRLPYTLPEGTAIVDGQGRDAGLRFVDLNGDGRADVVFSNAKRYGVWLFTSPPDGWSKQTMGGTRPGADKVPMIVRADGTNNGVWFKYGHLWVQNEDTGRAIPSKWIPGDLMPIDCRSFEQLLTGGVQPPQAAAK